MSKKADTRDPFLVAVFRDWAKVMEELDMSGLSHEARTSVAVKLFSAIVERHRQTKKLS
jgi:hypothetical protein